MRQVASKLLLSVGFLAVAVAITVAHRTPPTSYESSIYAATPTSTWIGLGIAFAIAIPVVLTDRGRTQALGVALGATAVTTIVALPVIRNYRFIGMGDALTHLGWVRDFVEGDMLPHELFYPGIHSIATVFHLVGGVPLERGLLFAVVFVFVPFVVFVPLVVRDLSGSATAVGFAAVVSWFVLPVNNVATHMGAHTNSNALFFVPVVLFALVAYARRRGDAEALPLGFSPYGALLLVAGAGLLFVHPQQMINVVVVLAAMAFVQYVARRRLEDHPILEHPTVYLHTAALGGFFVLWAVSNDRFRRAFSGLIYGLLTQDIGAGGEVDQRGASLAEIGGSIGELFAKMFLVSALVGLVAGLFVLATWAGLTRVDRETKSFTTYFGIALFPLGVMFLVYFFGTGTMAFRQVGFIFVILTILAGVALAHLFGWLSRGLSTPGANTLAAVALAGCLVLASLTIFASPFIYNPSQHVTDQQLSGYESALTHGDERLYAGFGFGVNRYGDAVHGTEGTERGNYYGAGDGVVDVEEFEAGNYSGAYGGEDYYFTVSAFDETRELEIYRGLHHSESALEGVESDPSADKVISNDEFRMYAVSAEE